MSLEEQLAELRATFAAGLPGRRSVIALAAAGVARGEPGPIADLERAVHQLAGIAAIHGFDGVAAAADAVLRGLGHEAPGQLLLSVDVLLRELEHAAATGP